MMMMVITVTITVMMLVVVTVRKGNVGNLGMETIECGFNFMFIVQFFLFEVVIPITLYLNNCQIEGVK